MEINLTNLTVYQCYREDKSTHPPSKTLLHYAKTCEEAEEFLSANGGGLFVNVLHNYSFRVKPKELAAKPDLIFGRTWAAIETKQQGN